MAESAPPVTPSLETSTPGRAHRAVAWVAVIGVVVLGAAGIVVADTRPSDAPRNNAETFVPADGSAAELTYETGEKWILESTRGTGGALLLRLPNIAWYHQLTLADPQNTGDIRGEYWRQTWTHVAGERDQLTELYQLADDGVRMIALTGGVNGFSYDPGLLILPADIQPGSVWSSEGDALPDGFLGYQSAGSAEDAGNGCLDVTLEVTYTDPDAGDAILLDTRDVTTWCPGSGAVESIYSSQESPGSTVTVPLQPDRPSVARPDEIPSDFAQFDSWSQSEVEFIVPDPAFGDMEASETSDGTVVALEGGVIAALSDADILGYQLGAAGEPALRDWVAHPGGRVTSLAGIGEVLLVSTTDRVVQAYDSLGRRAWSASFDDVVRVNPESDGAGGAIVAAIGGEVRRISLLDGSTLWSTSVEADPALSPVVHGDVVYVVDSWGIHALSLSDGSERWSVELDNATDLVATDERILTPAADGSVLAWDAVDGSPRWVSNYPGSPRTAAVIDGTLVVQGDQGMVGYTLSGSERWRLPGSVDLVSDGRVAVALDGSSVSVIDADGTVQHRWEIEPLDPLTTYQLLALGDRVWMFRTPFIATEWGQHG